jgi:hydrogenase maturation protease
LTRVPRDGSRIVVIGIGNPDRGDDAAGRLVAQRLRGALPTEIEVAEIDGEATALLALLDGTDRAVLIDACMSGGKPGAVLRFDVSDAPLPETRFGLSTHGVGLGEALELARTLGQLPPRVIVYAIEARRFDLGAPLSPPVADAVDETGELIEEELRSL